MGPALDIDNIAYTVMISLEGDVSESKASRTYLYLPILSVVVSSLSPSSSSIVMETPLMGGTTWPSTVSPGLPSNDGTSSGHSKV